MKRVFRRRRIPSQEEEIDLLQQKRIKELPLLLAAKNNDVDTIQKLISRRDIDLYERGAVGETALHVATLYDNFEAAQALLEAAPDLVNEPMTSDLYQGETALHIAVVNQNLNLVKELIRRGADVSSPQACGTFFSRNFQDVLYFGEHILSFAACVGNAEIVRLLIVNGANIKAQDSFGNTVLHILVLQPNKDVSCKMYDFILSFDKSLSGVPLETIRNKEGLTPFQQAATEGNETIFQHLVQKMKKTEFAFGPISYTLYDLTEIDSWAYNQSILKLISSSKRKEARRILDVEPVKELVNMKWCKYGRLYFYIYGVLFVLYMICVSLACANRPLKPRPTPTNNSRDITLFVQKTLQESYQTPADVLRLAGELISVSGAIAILILKVPGLLRVRDVRLFLEPVSGGPFHLIIVVYSCLILITFLMRITNTDGEVVPMSSALALGWCYLIYFARGFEMVGPFAVMLHKMMFGDLLRSLTLMIAVILGFGSAIYIVFQTEDYIRMGIFNSYSISLYSTYQLLVLVINSPANYFVDFPLSFSIVYFGFTIIGNLLMFNLLIAMMSDTHWRFAQERDEIWRLQVVATIVMLEQNLPRFMCPRAGIYGKDYGLGNKWYICIEDENINDKKEMVQSKAEESLQQTSETREPSKISEEEEEEEEKEEHEEDYSKLFLQLPSSRNVTRRTSSRGWKILRRTPMEEIHEAASQSLDVEDTYLI